MLFCALPSENDSNYENHEFWNNVDIYDCSDLNILETEEPKDEQNIKQTNKKKLKKKVKKHADCLAYKPFEKIDLIIS